MIALTTGLFLGLTLLFVHLWTNTDPPDTTDPDLPLKQDDLPAPWAGHGSSVFSLTALFSAYLASAILFGMPALVGAALGSVSALFFIRRTVRRQQEGQGFDHFLKARIFSLDRWDNVAGWILLGLTQIGLAASELVLLREVGIRGFGFAERHAEVIALSVGLVAYFYCLMGGYLAVFRTDIAQLVLVVVMALSLVPLGSSSVVHSDLLGMRSSSTLWSFGYEMPSGPRFLLHGGIGFVMGLGFLVSSPDAWKRVVVAEMPKKRSRWNFPLIAVAGILPFLLLLPVLVVSRPSESIAVLDPITLIFSSRMGGLVQMCVLLGMLSSFLSSFDSALLAATHIFVIGAPQERKRDREIERYWIWLGGCFLAIVVVATVSIAIARNPFFLASFVVFGYACLGGIIVGTDGLSRPVRLRGLGPLVGVALLLWCLYVVEAIPGIRLEPSEEQLGLFASGTLVLLTFSLVTWLGGRFGRSLEPTRR